MAELFRARDRDTGKVGEYTREFLNTWRSGYFILGPVAGKTPKPSALGASNVPVPGTNPEGGA